MRRCTTAFMLLLGIVMLFMPVSAVGDDPAKQVEEAFARFKNGDKSTIDRLDIQASLPYLAKYITDADPSVRRILIPLVRQCKLPAAVGILTALVVDSDLGNIGSKAVQALYARYSEDEVRSWGGLQLRDNLLRFVERSTGTAEALLLLATLPPREGEQEQLLKLAVSSQKEKTCAVIGEAVNVPVAIDLLLARLGNRDALQRTLDRVTGKTVRVDVAFIAANARIIADSALLLALVDRLDDTRTAVILGYPSHHGGPNSGGLYLRICDVALEQLSTKVGIDVGADVAARSLTVTMPRYSNTKLAEARRRLHVYFAAMPIKGSKPFN